MDNHDKAHYGIAAGLASAIGVMFAFIPESPLKWPDISPAVARNIAVAVNAVVPAHEFGVYCADAACVKVARLIANSAIEGASIHYEPLLAGDVNLSVGAPTKEEADKIKDAVEKASGGVLKVGSAVSGQALAYVSFGHLSKDAN